MQSKIDQNVPLLILIRDTHYDVYPPEMRKRMIDATMSRLGVDAKAIIVDDIESVNYGRGVGYEVNEIQVPDNIKAISATEIRARIDQSDDSWKDYVPEGADKVLEDYLTGRGMVVWFTGLPKCGKTTVARLVSEELEIRGIRAEHLDGSILRQSISKDLGFSKEDRDKNLERATFIAKLLSRNGAIVLASFITPYESERARIRKELEEKAAFIEVHIKASIDTCKSRDRDGWYEKAERGEVEYFTGVSDPYEEPANPDLVVDTETKSAQACANEVIRTIETLV